MGAMEAASAQHPRELSGDKAQRIVDAMRVSVAQRGAAASTFDHVAREAGVSRGLLHYYFGTKERLLAEVVRRDCDIRMQLLDDALAGARTAADIIDALVRSLEGTLREDPGFFTLLFELFTLSQRNDEIAEEIAELGRRTREHVGGLLGAAESDGVITLGAPPEAVADVLFGLADGLAFRFLCEPERDKRPGMKAAILAARALLRDPDA
jgi:AcrR family transcriptional regulator